MVVVDLKLTYIVAQNKIIGNQHVPSVSQSTNQ